MSTYRDDQGDTFPPPEADAQEQRQNAVRRSGRRTGCRVTWTRKQSEADLAEQGAYPAGTLEEATSLPADANPADALEQRQEIPTRDEGRRT